jgi:6-phosphogluconolactonase/glucosamine-6-phosphate isomerase/deaminase
MQLIQTTDWQSALQALSERLQVALSAGQRVLWLVPGGSNMPAAVTIMAGISEALSQGLTVTLSDERFGAVGHADSNWQQLLDGGFDAKAARCLPVLVPSAVDDLEHARQHYDQLLATAFSTSDIAIAQLGMGADGHVAGILPHSPAIDASGLAAAYHTETFTRLTTTFQALRQVNVAYVLAYGAEKFEALDNLGRALPLIEQPAQILKSIPEAYVYNDQKGDPS